MAPANERGGVLLAASAVAIFAGVVMTLAGRLWPIVVYRLIVDGGIALLWLAAATGIGLWVISLVKVSVESRALHLATAAALGLGLISLLVLGLGLLGWLNRAIAVALVAGGLVALARFWSNIKLQTSNFEPRSWLWLLIVPSASVVLVAALVPPGVLWRDEPHGYDVLEYHLQVPREWYELGRIVPLEHNVFSYFPFNVEMHYLLAMHLKGGPWAGMYLAQLMHFGFIAMTVVALAGCAKPQAAIAAACVPWMGLLGSVAYNEGGLLLFGTLAIAWVHQTQQLKPMVLAGAMAGFACGVKLTAVPLLVLAVPIALAISLRGRGVLKFSAGFVLAAVLTYSPWLIRNAIWTGNPAFPEATSLLGRGPLSETQVERWKRAHSARSDQRSAWIRAGAFGRQVLGDWRFGFAVLPLGLCAIALARSSRVAILAILLAIHLAFWVGMTHLQGRFFVLAIPIASILIAQVSLRWWPTAIVTAAVVGAATGVRVMGQRLVDLVPLIAVDDLKLLIPQAAQDAIEANRPLVLVGDAQAFRYVMPMSNLRYRTVFDVDVKEGQSIVDAWIGPNRPNDAIILVDPSELRRFAETYWQIPMIETDRREPYVLP